jgi:hypothetical protein
VYGNAVFTAAAELETEVADLDVIPELDDVPKLELVLAIDEVPEELAELLRVERVVLRMLELELELELALEFDGGPAEKTTAPAG